MPVLEHQATAAEEGRTVKSLAMKEMHVSRGLFSSLKFRGGVRLDGQAVHADARVRAGQVLRLEWEDSAPAITPYPVDLPVPYADEHYLIVDKPAPLPTLSSAWQTGPTLENALFAQLGCPKDYVFRPVNRLDKGTSGLMAVARDGHAQQLLQKQLHTDTFCREYLAVCRGALPEREGIIDLPIGKMGEGIRRIVTPDGIRAVTHYRVEREERGLSLVRLRLETGRTHQIRVHLRALGCPIVGDYLYGQAHPALPGRFALHACFVSFQHPFTGETIRLASSLPDQLAALMEMPFFV